MRLLFIILCCFFMSRVAMSQQTGKISGKITDKASGEVLPFASIAILKNTSGKDSLVGGTTTNESGNFTAQNLPLGAINLRISYAGYQVMNQSFNLESGKTEIDLGTIALLSDTTMLKEVKVIAEKNAMDVSLEKRTFNVSKNLTTIGGTAETLLRNIPSLTIDASGTATLRNLTTTIYINGKPTQLTLAQIPANQIESVEVMTNPSAKYDASASGGIVNLVLKKNREPGYNGTGSFSFGSNSRYDGMVNLNMNRGKWSLTALYNINSTKNPLNNYTKRTSLNTDGTPSGFYNQNTNIRLDNVFQSGRLSIGYDLNKQNTFALAGSYVAGVYNSFTSQQYQNLNADHTIAGFGSRTTQPENSFRNAGIEFDFKHSFKQKGHTLSFTSGYTHNQLSNAADWLTNAYNADSTNQTGYPENNKITGQTTGDQIIAQLDYVKPLNDSSKLEMGLRSYTYVRNQKYLFNLFNPSTEESVLQPTFSQDAKITETVNAFYILYSRKLTRGFDLQAGLRMEQSALHGISRLDSGATFGYNYPTSSGGNWIKAFFPSFSISKKLNSTSEIGLNLSRKVGRPNFRQLFVGIQSNDRQNITVGNPKIQPEFVNTAELNYNKSWGKIDWLATAYYILEDNTIKPNVQPSPTDPSVFITTFINTRFDIQAGIDNTITFSPSKNFTILANINAYNTTLQTADYKRTMYRYDTKLNLTYRLPSGITLQLNLSNNSKAPQLQGYRSAVRAADFAIRKSFMNNRASVVFSVNDIFNSRKPVTIFDQPTAYQESMNRREIRYYKFTLQLPLGKSESNRKNQKMARPDVDFSN